VQSKKVATSSLYHWNALATTSTLRMRAPSTNWRNTPDEIGLHLTPFGFQLNAHESTTNTIRPTPLIKLRGVSVMNPDSLAMTIAQTAAAILLASNVSANQTATMLCRVAFCSGTYLSVTKSSENDDATRHLTTNKPRARRKSSAKAHNEQAAKMTPKMVHPQPEVRLLRNSYVWWHFVFCICICVASVVVDAVVF